MAENKSKEEEYFIAHENFNVHSKVLFKLKTCSFIYILSMDAFKLQQH